MSLIDKNTLGRWDESRYENTVVEAEKCHVELKESGAVRIHANQKEEFVGEEVLTEYESVRKREERVETVVLVTTEVLEIEGQQKSIGDRDELVEAANREE